MMTVTKAEMRELREKWRTKLAARCPLGWSKRAVRPSWPDQKGCRGCGEEVGPWTVVLLTRRMVRERQVIFTFVALCDECCSAPDTAHELAVRAFSEIN